MSKELQVVSYEQAKRLKALGFDWEVQDIYDRNGIDRFEPQYNNWNESRHNVFSMPTIALALKWMRDEKGMYFGIPCMLKRVYYYIYQDGDDEPRSIHSIQYATYEEAESALLDALLTYLEKGEKS